MTDNGTEQINLTKEEAGTINENEKDSVLDKKKWLENAFATSSEKEEKTEHVSNGQRQPASNEMTSDRVKWIEEQAFNETNSGSGAEVTVDDDKVGPISSELTSDRVKWLQEQAFKKDERNSGEDNGEEEAVSNELTTDKIKWLQEQAFKKNETNHKLGENGDDGPESVSNELTSDKVKWLQEQAFKKNTKFNGKEDGDGVAPVSNELTSDKIKWLQEQAFKKDERTSGEDNGEEEPVSNELTSDKVKWLQEQAFKKVERTSGEDNGEEEPVSNELTSDKVKWLQEQAFKKDQATNGEDNDEETVSNELTSDKVKWLQEQAFKNSNAALHEPADVQKKTDHYDDESSDDSYDSEDEDEESIEDQDKEEIPDGTDTDDLYALLAYSKGLVKDRKIEDTPQDKEPENTTIQSDHDNIDEDLSEGSSVSELDDHSESDDDGDDAPHENVVPIPTRESEAQKKEKETQELWALLNYSKVRIATGSTPTADEAKALGISENNEVLLEDSDEEAGGGNKKGADSDLNDSFMTDDSNISDDESEESSLDERDLMDEMNQEDLAATRARALAALERTKDIYGDVDDAEKAQQKKDLKDLTENQMLKSIVLAEEASLCGAEEFTTQEKLSVLDNVRTPPKKPKPKAKTRFGRGRGGNKKRDVDAEVSSFRERARLFLSDTKKKAEQVLENMKETVEKIEKHNEQDLYYGPPSTLRKDSPFKKFVENVSKVEQNHNSKYGNENVLYV